MVKDLLFNAVGYIGVLVIILGLIWSLLELLNKLLHIVKYIIMYKSYTKEKDLYVNKNNLIVTKSGKILYNCATNSLERDIEILTKAIENCNSKIKLRDELTK